nr:hypothetical protein [uncultured Carboxylicivirga sp.]
MPFKLSITLIIISLLTSCNCSHQGTDINLSDFYRVYFEKRQDKIIMYSEADSLNSKIKLKEFGNAMWAYNDYLFRNYSETTKLYSHFKSLLPDTSLIRQEFNVALNNDNKFKDIFKNSLNKKSIPSITIDSLSIIASRFYLVDKFRNQVYVHLCANINEVQSLEQNEFSPFFNAFCFMTIRNNDEASDLASSLLIPYSSELNNPEGISDERLIQIKTEVFDAASENKQLQQILIKEYDKKRKFLNFELKLN